MKNELYSKTKEYRRLKAEKWRRKHGMQSTKDLKPRICRQCGKIFQPLSVRALCCTVECSINWSSLNRKRDTPEEKKGRRLRDHHHLTPEEFKTLIDLQNGLCSLCGKVLNNGQHSLRICIDHNHNCCPKNRSCKKCRRGILHSRCNLLLGYATDDINILQFAINYLEKWA